MLAFFLGGTVFITFEYVSALSLGAFQWLSSRIAPPAAAADEAELDRAAQDEPDG